MATLRDPLARTSTVTLEDLDALSASGMSSLGRGLRSGFIGTDINAAAAREASLRASTDPQALAQADAERAQIDSLRQRQSMYAPTVGRVEDIDGVGSALSYAAGQVGQGAASMADPLAAGVALQGAGNLMSRGPGMFKAGGALLKGAGYAVPFAMNQRQMTGEAYNAMVDDPELMARTSAQERETNANLYGAAAGALDTVVPGMIAGKLAGGGLRQGIAKSGLGARTLGGMGMGGMTELGQQAGQQQVLGYMNPDRDTSGDSSDNLNAFVGGAIGSGPMVMAGEMADSGYRRVGDTTERISGVMGDTIDLLAENPTVQAGVQGAKNKLDKIIDLAAGEDGKVTPESVGAAVGTAARKGKDMFEDYEQRLAERDFIAGVPPKTVDVNDDAAFRAWHAETGVERAQAVSDRITELAESGDEQAQSILAKLDSQDDTEYANGIEDGADHILRQDEWGKLTAEAERRAQQASRLSVKAGEMAGSAARAIGGAAVDFGKAVARGATKKNMQGESLVGQGAVYDPEAMRARDAAVDKESANWDQARQRSYNRATIVTEFMAAELKTAQAIPGVRMPGGSPEAMTNFAKDIGLEIADLAENWKGPTAKASKAGTMHPGENVIASNPAQRQQLSGPVSLIRNPEDSKGQQFSGLKYNLNRIGRSLNLMYGPRAEQVINEIQSIDGNTAPELFDMLREHVTANKSLTSATKTNRQIELEAQDAMVAGLGQDVEARLISNGVNVRTDVGKAKLLHMVDAVDRGLAPGAAVRALKELLGADTLMNLRRMLRPPEASREDLMEDPNAMVVGEGLTMDDDGEVSVAETNTFDKAVGQTTVDGMRSKRTVRMRDGSFQLVGSKRGADPFAPKGRGKLTPEAMLQLQDDFSRGIEEGRAVTLPAALRRPRLARTGETYEHSGEDAVEGQRTRLEKELGVDFSATAMIAALHKDAAAARKSRDREEYDRIVAQGQALRARMDAKEPGLDAEARQFFEDRSESGAWTARSMTVEKYLDEEGADPLRRVSLYRDYLRQDAASDKLSIARRKNIMGEVFKLGAVIGDAIDQRDGKASGLRLSPGERAAALAAANRYFGDRHIAVGEQFSDAVGAVPEIINPGEIKDMAAWGDQAYSKARLKGKEGTPAYSKAVSEANILVFPSAAAGNNAKELRIPVSDLVRWGETQRVKHEGTAEQNSRVDKNESFRDRDENEQFLNDLSLGIMAVMNSGLVPGKDVAVYKLNQFGKEEVLQPAWLQDTGVPTKTPNAKSPTKFVKDRLSGWPDSLQLATTSVFGLKSTNAGRVSHHKVKTNTQLQERMDDRDKLRNWSAEPFTAEQGEDTAGTSGAELWGTIVGAEATAKSRRGGKFKDMSLSTNSTPSGTVGNTTAGGFTTTERDSDGDPKAWTVQRTSAIKGKPADDLSTSRRTVSDKVRAGYRKAALKSADALDEYLGTLDPELSALLRRDGPNGATYTAGNRSYKSTDDGGWNDKGKYEYGATPGDYGPAPDGFDDVRSRTRALGAGKGTAYSAQKREFVIDAAAKAESRADPIVRELRNDLTSGLAMIAARMRTAALPKRAEGKYDVVGGAHYAVPVVAALSDANLASLDLTPAESKKLIALRAEARVLIDGSDLGKALKAEFGLPTSAAPEVGARLGKPSGVGEKAGTVANPVIGDLWAQDGVKVVSTNLGGVHGRGLAMQAKNKGLIGRGNVDFDSSPAGGEVITLAVKGRAPETAKVRGKPFSEQVVGGNLDLLKSEVRKLIKHARANPDTNFYLPFVGLGFGEGNPTDIMPVLEFASKEPNIFMVSKDQGTVDKYASSFVPGVRADATSRAKVKLTGTSVYLAKDQAKSDRANKFIGRGSAASSTAQYAKDWGANANTGSYTADDVVFVSAEGNRTGRIAPDLNELNKAMAAGATLVTDVATGGRNRPYNVGEREVASHLTKHGYVETESGVWKEPRLNSRIELLADKVLGKISGDSKVPGVFLRQAFDAIAALQAKGVGRDAAMQHPSAAGDIAALVAMKMQGDQRAAQALTTLTDNVDQLYSLTGDPDLTAAIESRLLAGGMTVQDLADEFMVSAVPEQYRAIAKAVGEIAGHVSIAYDANMTAGEGNGYYAPGQDKIGVWKGSPSKAALALHESVHAATSKALYKDADLHDAAYKLMAHVVGKDESLQRAYGLTNAFEFLAEGLSNEGFQKRLAAIPASGAVAKYLGANVANAWDAFVGIVRKALGMKPGTETALSQLIELGARAMVVTRKEKGAITQSDLDAAYDRPVVPSAVAEKILDAIADHKNVDDSIRDQIREAPPPGGVAHGAALVLATMKQLLDAGITIPTMTKFEDVGATVAAEIEDAGLRLPGSAKFNKQGKVTPESTKAERDAAVAEVIKTLGKDIDVRFEKTTGFSGAYLDKEAAIVISMTPAAGTLQTAYHEALHAFVARLVKGNAKAERVLNSLANHQPTLERVHALLDGFPAAQAQLADGEERIAFIYQFWRAGMLDLPVSPARTMLQKLQKFFRGVLGQVSDLERSAALLEAFAGGKYAGEPSVAGKVMAKHLLEGTWAPRTLRKMDGVAQKLAAWTIPAQSLLLMSDSRTAQKLGNTFWTNPGSEAAGEEREGYLNARERMARRYTNEFSRIVAGLSDRDHKDVLEHLQLETESAAIAYEPQREAVEKVRALLQRFRKYMVEEKGHKLGDRGPMYFPRMWSAFALTDKKAEFLKMMAENHPGEDAEAIHTTMVKNFADRNEDAINRVDDEGDKAILSPTQTAKHKRLLSFITGEQAAPFLEKSLVSTLSRYFHEGARAAEYTSRFGRKGEKLEHALSQIEAELRKAGNDRRKKGELKDQEAETKWVARQMRDVDNSVKAMEGTLGRDIGDTWRASNSWVTVYQNVRLLPMALFSSIVDPLGMFARGATMGEAYEGFLRGMGEVVRNWGEMITGNVKEQKVDKWDRLAMAVGSVDAAVFNHHVSEEYASVYMSAGAKKINDFMFKANGMESWNRGMRVAATKSAAMFIQRHKGLTDTHSARWLKELGLTPDDVHLNAGGELITSKHELAAQLGIDKDAAAAKVEKIHYAINRWVQGAVLTPNAAQRPAWGSDPHYSMFFHLKQFSYSFHQTLIKRAVNEMNYGNLAPIGAFAWYIPVMIASDIAKGLIQGGGELPSHMKGMDLGDWMAHGIQRSGMLGVGQLGVDAGGDLGSIGGPAVEQIIDAFSDPLERTMIKAAPAHSLYAEALR